LTNYNQLFFTHLTVIGQFLILKASSILLLLIVDHALELLKNEVSELRAAYRK